MSKQPSLDEVPMVQALLEHPLPDQTQQQKELVRGKETLVNSLIMS